MTVTPLLVRSLRYGGVLAAVVAVSAGGLGLAVSGLPGLVGGLMGAALAAVFLGLTAVSILVAGRVTGGDLTSPAFFGLVLGVWTLKLVLFFVLSLWLRGQGWIDTAVFSWTMIAAVLGSLVADVVAFQRSRIPLDVSLPERDAPR